MENLVIALAGAAISGVTFIAYKHPILFEREFAPKILYVALGALLVAVVYDAGVSSAHQELTVYLQEAPLKGLRESLEQAKMNSNVYLISLGAVCYGMFLSWLAHHMKSEDEKS